MTLTQGFNSLGTTIGPYLGSTLILAAATTTIEGASRAAEAQSVQGPYIGLGAVLLAIAVAIAVLKLPAIETKQELADASTATQYVHHESVWGYRHLVLGAVAIFMYVGGEVSIGSLLVNFMSHPDIAGLTEETAGKYLSLYWGGAMVGRFIGAAAMTRIKPGNALAFNAIVAIALLIIAMAVAGKAAMWAVLAIGLFNSIMFPTIFTLAIEGLGKHTGAGSGVLCMAIVGGAIVPVVQGFLADHVGLLHSFATPIVCYAYIAYYGLKGHNADLKPAR